MDQHVAVPDIYPNELISDQSESTIQILIKTQRSFPKYTFIKYFLMVGLLYYYYYYYYFRRTKSKEPFFQPEKGSKYSLFYIQRTLFLKVYMLSNRVFF